MKSLISAFALLAFVGTSTVPFVTAQAQDANTGATTAAPMAPATPAPAPKATTKKKTTAKKSAAKKTTKKKTAAAKKKNAAPAAAPAPKTM